MVADVLDGDEVPPVEDDPGTGPAGCGVDDREVVGQDPCSRVEEDVAVRAEAQQVLDDVGSLVLPGLDMGSFAVAVTR